MLWGKRHMRLHRACARLLLGRSDLFREHTRFARDCRHLNTRAGLARRCAVSRLRLMPTSIACLDTWAAQMTTLDLMRAAALHDPLLCQLLTLAPHVVVVAGTPHTAEDHAQLSDWLPAVCSAFSLVLLFTDAPAALARRWPLNPDVKHWTFSGLPWWLLRHILPVLPAPDRISAIAFCSPQAAASSCGTVHLAPSSSTGALPKSCPATTWYVTAPVHHVTTTQLPWATADPLERDLFRCFWRRRPGMTPSQHVFETFLLQRLLTSDRPSVVNWLSHPPAAASLCVVMVETRRNAMTVLTLLLTLTNLRRQLWDVCVFCSRDNQEYLRDQLGPRVRLRPMRYRGRFDVAAYNRLLKSRAFWQELCCYHRVLIIQDDSVILRPGLEQSGLLAWEYVGPPWSQLNAPGLVREVGEALVGNGGLSLRCPRACAHVLQRSGLAHKVSFDNQDYPEDVFFSGALRRANRRVADRHSAGRFGAEQVILCPPPPFGVHKPYMYHNAQQMQQLLHQYTTVISNI